MGKKEIPLSVPNLDIEIVEHLKECIQTGWVSTGGRFISEFEEKVARYVGVKEAVSMQSGTAALHIALKVLGIRPGDLVLVPSLTFIAAVNPVTYVGAEPLFMDCDDSLCMDPEKVETFLKEECRFEKQGMIHKETGRRVAAILPVHIFGNLCDMGRFLNLSEAYQIPIIEDATEALGSYYTDGPLKGRFAGTIGKIGVYSFNANKIITTGGGGMIVSHDQALLEHARYLGIQAKNNTLFFQHDEIGYNYRMLNLQAALGVSQIDRLEAFIQTKIRNYELYKKYLAGTAGISLLPFSKGQRSNHWFYSLVVEEGACGVSRNQLMEKLLEEGIQCRPLWKLIHTQKPYRECRSYQIEKAPYYESHVLNIPCSTNLGEEDVEYVSEMIRAITK